MDLQAHLLALETQLHQQAAYEDAQALSRLIDENFFEFGGSGTVWTRDAVIQALRGKACSPRRVADFRLTRLADDVALVTYQEYRLATAEQPAAQSLRSSIWRRRDTLWRVLFHQCTPL